jgi:hypothetical protein
MAAVGPWQTNAIQDIECSQEHYGRLLPQDKATLAATTLNQVSEAA